MTEHPEVVWDVPGWDWEAGDHAWLSSQSGIYKDGVSIFFVHGGRIRHQAHIPEGDYSREELLAIFDKHADGLDDARLVWTKDSGGGDSGLWVEGTRPPNEDDLARLAAARERQEREDRLSLHFMNERRKAKGLSPLAPS